MRVLITGSSGFIGSSLVRACSAQGDQVLGVDVKPPIDKQHTYLFQECDICNLSNLSKIISDFQPEVIYHLAARTDLLEKVNIQGYQSNIIGVRNLITSISQVKSVKRCIFTSSQLVCRVGYIPLDQFDYQPSTLYGESKVLTEQIVRETDGGEVEWCICRPTTVWGPGMSVHYQKFLNLIQTGRYFHISNRPLYKSYSYIGNIVYQYQKMMAAPVDQIHQRIFYLADYEPISLRDWANSIQAHMGAKSIPTYPEVLARLAAYLGNCICALGYRNFPFNSFRLNNILTEYIFDLSPTAKVCGELPFTMDEGVKAMVKWKKDKI